MQFYGVVSLEGKGFCLWKISQSEGGDVDAIANVAQQAGLRHLLIKIADGAYPYNIDRIRNVDLVPPLVQALKRRGISPWGWHYVRGNAPMAEARTAVQRVRDLELDGYVVDAEAPYNGRHAAAETFMEVLRKDLPHTPIALSSYRFPSYHPQIPWREFLEKCDFNMPQVYWQGANNPAAQLERCLREFRDMTPFRPVIPIGAAYSEHSWVPKAQEIIEFLTATVNLDLPGANFWEWSAARRVGLWRYVAYFPWPDSQPIVKDVTERYMEVLNTRNPKETVGLYSPYAVHVSATRTLRGLDAIRAWYHRFFLRMLPNATFTLTGYSSVGSSRHLTWTANSTNGKVLNGNDAIGLADGKIAYHYTYFTVT